ncbi:hypothetical protein PBY51_018401 [Eleginops maclovinus]|uniref:Interleukin-2 receptor subunit beta N-terminal domain-containing protein n=1 Tax=Eleginops maclovinus TaxID=56733 RepID=A0AAN8AY68_ELEMC|nr:hypothetical protein PBY51_018401 [Eleginops maclovinus]
MERSLNPRVLFVLLALLPVSRAEKCSSVPDKNLSCSSDYNDTITCVWNRTSDLSDSVCTISAHSHFRPTGKYANRSCTLKPVEGRPTQMMCDMHFGRNDNFQSTSKFSMKLICEPGQESVSMVFMPACHIKLKPPQQPRINITTISWHPGVQKIKNTLYYYQLQWKQEDQSWSDPSVQEHTKVAPYRWKQSGSAEKLEPDWLIRGERYEARVQVKISDEQYYRSTWSDWSPTASWVSTVGAMKQPQSSDLTLRVSSLVAVIAAVVVFLILVRFKTDKTTWVYIVKKITGPPLPNPKDSFLQNANFQSWLTPHFFAESFHSLFGAGEMVSVDIVSSVDAVVPCSQEVALLHKIRSEVIHATTSSSFADHSYSNLLVHPPTISSLTAGNLLPCVADAPYGPVGGQSEREHDEDRGKEEDIHQLLSKGSSSRAVLLVSDYEKVEEMQGERGRLQSLDSGVGSGEEEVSQESLEADSITVEEEREEGRVNFHKSFGGGGGMQVDSDYKKVHPVEEEDESTDLLLPPPPSCSSPSLPPLSFSKGLSLALKPDLLETMALVSSSSRSVKPSGDGYMAVRQEQS